MLIASGRHLVVLYPHVVYPQGTTANEWDCAARSLDFNAAPTASARPSGYVAAAAFGRVADAAIDMMASVCFIFLPTLRVNRRAKRGWLVGFVRIISF